MDSIDYVNLWNGGKFGHISGEDREKVRFKLRHATYKLLITCSLHWSQLDSQVYLTNFTETGKLATRVRISRIRTVESDLANYRSTLLQIAL